MKSQFNSLVSREELRVWVEHPGPGRTAVVEASGIEADCALERNCLLRCSDLKTLLHRHFPVLPQAITTSWRSTHECR